MTHNRDERAIVPFTSPETNQLAPDASNTQCCSGSKDYTQLLGVPLWSSACTRNEFWKRTHLRLRLRMLEADKFEDLGVEEREEKLFQNGEETWRKGQRGRPEDFANSASAAKSLKGDSAMRRIRAKIEKLNDEDFRQEFIERVRDGIRRRKSRVQLGTPRRLLCNYQSFTRDSFTSTIPKGISVPSRPGDGGDRYRRSFLSRRLKENGRKRDARIERAKEVRSLLDEEQRRLNIERYNDKQLRQQRKREEEDRIERARRLRTLVCLASKVSLLLDGLREKKTYFLVATSLSKHATVIQSLWRTNRAKQVDAKHSHAISVLQRFSHKVTAWNQAKRIEKAARIIRWCFVEYADADFRKVVKSYRYRVVNCQRFCRQYMEVTRARLKLLSMKWDIAEKELTEEKRKASAVPLVPKPPTMLNFSTASQYRAEIENNPAYLRSGCKLSVAKPPEGLQGFLQTRTTSVRDLCSPGSSLRTGSQAMAKRERRSSVVIEQKKRLSTASIIAAVDYQATQPRKITRRHKIDILKQYLHECRQEFRDEANRFKSSWATRNPRPEDMLNLEDIKAMLHAKTSQESKEILRSKMDLSKTRGVQHYPTFCIYTDTTNHVMKQLVKRAEAHLDWG